MVFREDSVLHYTTKMGNMTAVDMLVKASKRQDRTIEIDNINECENSGFTAVRYAIVASR